jgi:von Willebrand factor type A domain
MRFRTVTAVTLGLPLALIALGGITANASSAARATVPFSEAKPFDVVVLADESGSMADFKGELPGEQQAAAEIANAAWSADSQVAIYGFGSAPPGKPESDAVDKICGLTSVTTQQDIAALDGCASHIKTRASNAWNTDFNAALTVAGQVLAAQEAVNPGAVPLIFMLTDGALDLGSATATAAARPQLSGVVLPGLASQHIEVWPVGFGQADMTELNLIAAGSAQSASSCASGTGGAPQATSVPPNVTGQTETEQIQEELLKAFAAASCATVGHPQWGSLAPGKRVTLHVAVNPLTSLGSIVVNKGNAAVTVTYTDPDGGHVSDTAAAPATGSLNGGAYQLSSSGPAARQEALRLDYPVPGQWAVTFYNPTMQTLTVGTQVLWQGQVTPDIDFKPTTGASGKQIQIMVKPALDARPVRAADLTPLHVAVTVQWRPGGPQVRVPVTFDAADGLFTGPVTVPAGQSGQAQVTTTVQAAGITGAAGATLSYQPGGGLAITVSIPSGTRVNPGGTLNATATFTNQDNTGQPVTSVQFLLSGLSGTGYAVINQPPVTIGSGTGSVPVIIHVGTTRGQVQGDIDWEVAGTTVQHPAGYLNISIEPPTPWYEQPLPWVALAVVLLGGTGLYTRRRFVADRAERAGKERQRAEQDRLAANRNVRDAGLALLRKDMRDDVAFLRWTGDNDGYIDERWFNVVRRTTSKIPVLVETTRRKCGTLLLTRAEEDGTFRLTAPGIAAPAPPDGTEAVPDIAAANGDGVAPVAASPDIQRDRAFDPPPGADLDDCVFIVTLGDAPRAKLPDPGLEGVYDDDNMPVTTPAEPDWRDMEFERPDPTVYDDFSDFDEQGGADGGA